MREVVKGTQREAMGRDDDSIPFEKPVSLVTR